MPAEDDEGHESATQKAAARIRCESCRSVVSTRHAWDRVTCACGRLTVSGKPWAPRVSWPASPGAGWSELPADSPSDDDADEHEVTTPRAIGYLRTS